MSQRYMEYKEGIKCFKGIWHIKEESINCLEVIWNIKEGIKYLEGIWHIKEGINVLKIYCI